MTVSSQDLATYIGYILLAISEILSLIPGIPQNGIVHTLLVSMASVSNSLTTSPPQNLTQALQEVVADIPKVVSPPAPSNPTVPAVSNV